jgi:hypothetical protein
LDDPLRRLMLALLGDAIVSFQKHAVGVRRRDARLFTEVNDWFLL